MLTTFELLLEFLDLHFVLQFSIRPLAQFQRRFQLTERTHQRCIVLDEPQYPHPQNARSQGQEEALKVTDLVLKPDCFFFFSLTGPPKLVRYNYFRSPMFPDTPH